MKREDALFFIQRKIDEYMSSLIGAPDTKELSAILLREMEDIGMKPPCVSEEDVQAIMSVYYGGYSVNQWDEDLEKDEQVMEAKRRRAEARQRRFQKKVDLLNMIKVDPSMPNDRAVMVSQDGQKVVIENIGDEND